MKKVALPSKIQKGTIAQFIVTINPDKTVLQVKEAKIIKRLKNTK